MPQFFILENHQIYADSAEVARYLGYKKSNPPDSTISEEIKKCIAEMKQTIAPKAVYEKFDLKVSEQNEIAFADLSFKSVDLARNLKGCRQVVIFASTLGAGPDALIRKAQIENPAKAAILQATGAMFIESFVDNLNETIEQEAMDFDLTARPRFSPGYGDVPLSMQKDFFRLLPCSKIGLTLMDSLIMAPEKSVTAFVGLC